MKKTLFITALLGSVASFVTAPYALAGNAKTDSAAVPSQKLVLQKGMPAETILSYYGKPAEVDPVKGAGINAEKWTYRRVTNSGIIQTANTEMKVQSFIGLNDGGKPTIGDVIIPDYRLKYVRIYQVTCLLMIDGKLEVGRQWKERSEEFAN